MTKHRTAILGVLAALALPASAGAAEPPQKPVGPIPVPEGQLQHTVRELTWESNIGKNRAVRIETWVSSEAGRMVQRDRNTGALVGDCFEDRRGVRCYDPERDEIREMPPGPGGHFMSVDSWEREGVLIKQQVDMGWFVFGADTTFRGQPAKQLEDTPQAPSDTDSRHYITAEPETLYPLKRVITGSGKTNEGVQTFTQTDEVVLREVLDPAKVEIRFGSYPTADVKRFGDKSASAAKSKRAKRARKAKRRNAAARRAKSGRSSSRS